METLPSLLKRALALFGENQSALAIKLGLDRSRVSRALKGQYSFEVVFLLRLARILQMRPADVLRAAGKVDEALLLDELYGRAPATPEAQLLASLALLDTDERDAVSRIVQVVLGGRVRRGKGTKRQAVAGEKPPQRRIGKNRGEL